jgi:hypothetical protein
MNEKKILIQQLFKKAFIRLTRPIEWQNKIKSNSFYEDIYPLNMKFLLNLNSDKYYH